MKIATRMAPVLFLLLLTATAAPADQIGSRQGPGSRALVTAEELATNQSSNLFDFVRVHRPGWLRTRGVTSSGPVQVMVYIDGIRAGSVSQLARISTAVIAEMRYLDGREATTRWGAGHSNGAILVTTGLATIPRGASAAAGAPV